MSQLTLRIPRGRIHAIVGANGAGKYIYCSHQMDEIERLADKLDHSRAR